MQRGRSQGKISIEIRFHDRIPLYQIPIVIASRFRSPQKPWPVSRRGCALLSQMASLTATSGIIVRIFTMDTGKGEVTLLLDRLAGGDRSAEEALMPRVYAELHRLAVLRSRGERSDHTLQATALVNEAYL